MPAFLAGCGTDSEKLLYRAVADTERAGVVDQALAAGRVTDPLPDDCRQRERSGVRSGERLDIALVKTDRALGRANDRVGRCAAWHDAKAAG